MEIRGLDENKTLPDRTNKWVSWAVRELSAGIGLGQQGGAVVGGSTYTDCMGLVIPGM